MTREPVLGCQPTKGAITGRTAGALGSGERIWMLAKLPNTIRVRGTDDITEQFLLLSNSHNGSSSLRVFFTPIRVVCANTLGAAERRGRKRGVSIYHRGDLKAKVGEAQKILGLASRFYDDLETKINHLASSTLSKNQLETYFQYLYPDPVESKSKRATNVREELTRLFEEGMGQDIPGIRHSTWAAFNAVTEYIDHHRSSRGANELEVRSNRLKSAWFGSGSTNQVPSLGSGHQPCWLVGQSGLVFSEISRRWTYFLSFSGAHFLEKNLSAERPAILLGRLRSARKVSANGRKMLLEYWIAPNLLQASTNQANVDWMY